MRLVRRKSGISTIVIALGLAAWSGSDAAASTLIGYSTSGTIDSTGVSGSPVISFISLNSASFKSPSYFSLGDFQVAPLPAGDTTTYTNTPFKITLLVDSAGGSSPVPNQTPIVLTGELNGKITGPKQSTVRATFDNVGPIQFQTGPYTNTLRIPDPTVTLVPSTTNNGLTTAEAHLRTVNTGNPQPVPEPSTMALFVTALAGLGLRRRLRGPRPA